MTQLYQAGITPPPAQRAAGNRGQNVMESSPNACAAAGLELVAAVRPVAPYIGGKRNLARRLVPLIGAIPHETYAEAFVGMGGIFLRRDRRPRAEVINDWSEDVSTFFRILQRHYVPVMEMLRFEVTTRAGFERLSRTDPSTLTDLERAARFLYLQRLAFGGKVAGRNFGVDPGAPARFDITKLGPLLEAVHERLASVVIERLPWGVFVDKYDRPGTLFYLDPPYYESEDDYGAGMFGRTEFALMAARLARLKGRFVLSLNDRPDVREIFSAFIISEVATTYTIGGGAKATAAAELIISNCEALAA